MRKILDRKIKGQNMEQCATLRWRNLGREKSKGFKDDRCRWCEKETECLKHIWICRKAREEMKKDWVEQVEENGLTIGGRPRVYSLSDVIAKSLGSLGKSFGSLLKVSGNLTVVFGSF